MGMGLTRRELLLAGAATVCVAAVPAGSAVAGEAVTTAQFLALSRSLTGAAGLDGDVAAALLRGFLARGQGAALAALAAGGETAENRALADEVVAAWYSGVAPDGTVATFDQALLWQALAFSKPFGSCGGATGYWAEPPQG